METNTNFENNQSAETHSDGTSGGASIDNTTTASAGVSTGDDNASIGIEASAKTGTEASVEGGLDGFNVIEDYPDGYVQLGNIQLIHGMYLNANHAKTHLQKVRSNIMYGHTHQLQVYSENGLTAYNIGNLADTDSPIFSYTNRFEKVNWKQGFAVITLDKGNTHVQVIEPVNNSFVYNGQIY